MGDYTTDDFLGCKGPRYGRDTVMGRPDKAIKQLTTINNASTLLGEALYNGEKSKDQLYAWFLGEKGFIERTMNELDAIKEMLEDEKSRRGGKKDDRGKR